MEVNLSHIIKIFFYFLATFFEIKTVFYGSYEIEQKNKFGGTFIIIFSAISYILFLVMMSMQ